MFDVIVIGAGPAGLSATIYLKRFEKNVLVLEEKSYGGQIINSLCVENYPGEKHISGYCLATKMYEQAKEFGAIIKNEKVIEIKNSKIKKVITSDNIYKTKAIIFATGCQNRKLELDSLDNFLGNGLSYCATCDGAFYKGRNVCVVGGGNTAIEDAMYLSDIANNVYLVHRRDTFRAPDKIISLLKEKNNVHFILNSNIVKINGSNQIESIEVSNGEHKKIINIDGLFIAIGQIPNNEVFKDLVKLDENGYVISKENCHTNKKGLFVAGDVRKKEIRQLVTATSDGVVAAVETVKYLNNMK